MSAATDGVRTRNGGATGGGATNYGGTPVDGTGVTGGLMGRAGRAGA